ncbi:MAG: hypothetical protein JEZ06_08690 [Anaerolineaceae bacterium]|nr:hypothetical protein [Anaerolineaceae bacterium]
MHLQRIQTLLNDMPDYNTFMTVEELNESTHILVQDHPETVLLSQIGHSRQGEAIEMLRIGEGSKKVLLFGTPHPNEPVGSMLLEFLSQKLAEDADLRAELNCTWYLIKCIDPDGTRLNEGWFKGPFTLSNYARNYYRPPQDQQVEWSFPAEYKTLRFDRPMPETKALMDVLERVQPDMICSLHNSGFGGTYLYLSESVPDKYKDFYALAEEKGLPLHLGEPELPFVKHYGPAVFKMHGVQDQYDFLAANSKKDPAESLRMGASSYEYARRFGNPFFMICEVPYFYNALIRDTSPGAKMHGCLIKKSIFVLRHKFQQMKAIYQKVSDELSEPSAFRDAIEYWLGNYEQQLNAKLHWVVNNEELECIATTAEVFDNDFVSRFYGLLSMGMFLRMLENQVQAGTQTESLNSAFEEMTTIFEKEAAYLERELEYEVVSIRNLVSMQLGSILLMLD